MVFYESKVIVLCVRNSHRMLVVYGSIYSLVSQRSASALGLGQQKSGGVSAPLSNLETQEHLMPRASLKVDARRNTFYTQCLHFLFLCKNYRRFSYLK